MIHQQIETGPFSKHNRFQNRPTSHHFQNHLSGPATIRSCLCYRSSLRTVLVSALSLSVYWPPKAKAILLVLPIVHTFDDKFSFCFPTNILIYFQYWKMFSLGKEFQFQPYFFNHFEDIFHCLLNFVVSFEKSAY